MYICCSFHESVISVKDIRMFYTLHDPDYSQPNFYKWYSSKIYFLWNDYKVNAVFFFLQTFDLNVGLWYMKFNISFT